MNNFYERPIFQTGKKREDKILDNQNRQIRIALLKQRSVEYEDCTPDMLGTLYLLGVGLDKIHRLEANVSDERIVETAMRLDLDAMTMIKYARTLLELEEDIEIISIATNIPIDLVETIKNI